MKALYCLATCGVMLLMGCNAQPPSQLNGRVGQMCEVQFRRDALGAAAPSGISPQTGSYNGMPMSVMGTLTKVHADWIQLRDNDSDLIIPTHSILYLKFEAKQPAQK